jgi:hypothetical protein
MRFSIEKMPTSFVATAAFCYLAAAFHVGYFSAIGLEFISLVGPSDLLFSARDRGLILPDANVAAHVAQPPYHWALANDSHRLMVHHRAVDDYALVVVVASTFLHWRCFSLLLWANEFGWVLHVIVDEPCFL